MFEGHLYLLFIPKLISVQFLILESSSDEKLTNFEEIGKFGKGNVFYNELNNIFIVRNFQK